MGTQHRLQTTAFVDASRFRALHLVDLENLLGGWVTPERSRMVWDLYAEASGWILGDHVVIAASRRVAAKVAFDLPRGYRIVVGENEADGADRALCEAIDPRHTAKRFGRVVIGSGDHYFTSLAEELGGLGVPVTQVLGGGKCAASLRLACLSSSQLPQYLVARSSDLVTMDRHAGAGA